MGFFRCNKPKSDHNQHQYESDLSVIQIHRYPNFWLTHDQYLDFDIQQPVLDCDDYDHTRDLYNHGRSGSNCDILFVLLNCRLRIDALLCVESFLWLTNLLNC